MGLQLQFIQCSSSLQLQFLQYSFSLQLYSSYSTAPLTTTTVLTVQLLPLQHYTSYSTIFPVNSIFLTVSILLVLYPIINVVCPSIFNVILTTKQMVKTL